MPLPSPEMYSSWQEFSKALIMALEGGDVLQVQGGSMLVPPGYTPVWQDSGGNLYEGNNFLSIPAADKLFQIDTFQIADAAVETQNVADAAIHTAKIAEAAIVTALIGDAQIVTAKIADLAVNDAKIANAAISSVKIQDAAVTHAKIGELAVREANIFDLAVKTGKIDDLAVTNAKIALLAVDTANIVDLAVQTGKIDDLAVTNAKIALLAVDSANIVNLAVKTAHIDDLQITTLKIADNAVTVPVGAETFTPEVVSHSHTTASGTVAEGLTATISVPTGQPVSISYMVVSTFPGDNGRVKLIRRQNGVDTVIRGSQQPGPGVGLGNSYTAIIVDDPAPTDPVTYVLQYHWGAAPSGLEVFNVSYQVMTLLECKK